MFKKLNPLFYNDLCGINNRLMLSALIRRKGKSFTPNRCPAMYYSMVFDGNAPLDHHERLDGNIITDDDITLRNDGKRADIAIFADAGGKGRPNIGLIPRQRVVNGKKRRFRDIADKNTMNMGRDSVRQLGFDEHAGDAGVAQRRKELFPFEEG